MEVFVICYADGNLDWLFKTVTKNYCCDSLVLWPITFIIKDLVICTVIRLFKNESLILICSSFSKRVAEK